MRSARAGSRAGLAAALACVVMAVVPAPASAAITNLELVEADAVEQPSTATCPAGKLVVGAGAGLWQGDGEVVMRNIRPRADLTAVDVQGVEDETGAPAGWSAHAYAICATPPPGLERVAVTSASTSDTKTVAVQCPAGKSLLGVGGEIDGGGGQVGVEDMIPGAGLTSVTVTGAEDENGYTGSWTVTGYAVCSPAGHGPGARRLDQPEQPPVTRGSWPPARRASAWSAWAARSTASLGCCSRAWRPTRC